MIHPWNQSLFGRLIADRERMPHAILLQGPRGIGKLDLAVGLARWALCEQPSAQGACGTCGACHWFGQGNHPDYRLVEPLEAREEEGEGKAAKKGGRNIKVEQVREVTEFLNLTAHRGGWRVAIFHPAEMMQAAAANALLKTLEEPPARVLLILVSHQAGRLLPTVVSRCRRVDVSLPERGQALDWLRGQAPGTDPDAALDEAGGAPLLALSCLEPDYVSRRETFLDQLCAPDRLDVCALAEACKADPGEVWQWLSRWVHDIDLQRQAGRSRYFPQRADTAARLATNIDPTALLRMRQAMTGAARVLRHPLNTTLLLESWLMQYGGLFAAMRGATR